MGKSLSVIVLIASCSRNTAICRAEHSGGRWQVNNQEGGRLDSFDALVKSAAHWRERAEEARIQAEAMSNDMARANLMNIAETYDRLAEFAE